MRSRLTPLFRCGLLALLTLLPGFASADNVLRYPRAPTGDEFRHDYPLAVLQLALDKAHSPLRLQPSAYGMEQNRALLSLEENSTIDVLWTMTSIEREERLIPVRIGIDKGLYGWRLAMLRQGSENLLRDVRDLDDLRKLQAGQGHDWPDTDILRQQNLPVMVSSSYDSLFRMLAAGRFDYLPRSVIEIWGELKHHHAKGVVADPYLALHYPTATYFFFSPHRPDLAETVRQGLEAALADGSFDHLFLQHFGAALQQARLHERHLIELPNPLLPPATPLDRKELWLDPRQLPASPATP